MNCHNRKQNWTLNVSNIKESSYEVTNQVQNKGAQDPLKKAANAISGSEKM